LCAQPIEIKKLPDRHFWHRGHGKAEREVLTVAAHAMPSPDDPPEFRQWLDALCRPHLTNDERGDILFAMAAWFEVTP
jgi:hypothetical protein